MTVEARELLYDHLPGEETNPLMENTIHVKWGHLLIGAVRHTLAGTGALVTGNVRLSGVAVNAPDLMVVPDWNGEEFGDYEPGPGKPVPSVCIEVLSPSNRGPGFTRRLQKLLELGVPELYVVDPEQHRVTRRSLGPTGAIVETDAIGIPSPGLNMTFVRLEHTLAVCCPAGRVVSPESDPYNWIEEEQRRADDLQGIAEARLVLAEEQRARADAAEAEVARLRALLDREP